MFSRAINHHLASLWPGTRSSLVSTLQMLSQCGCPQASCRWNYHRKEIRSSMNRLSLGKNYFYWNNASTASTLNIWAWQFIVNKLNLLFIDSSINMASSDIDQLLSYPRQHQRCLNQKETKSLRNFQKIKPGGILWTQEVEGISDEVREDTGW